MTHVQNGGRTKGFTTLFMIELWERFGYYGMAILLVLFMKDYLGFSDTRATLTWGAFAAMVYAIPAIGGWLGDKILGARRMVALGTSVLAVGYLLLAIPGPNWLLFYAMGVVAVGNGLFKANNANLVSNLYEGDPSKIDGAFTMYYMAVNVGSLISQFLTPIVRVTVGWHAAFAVCGIGLVLGLLNYFIMRRFIIQAGSAPDFEPLRVKRLLAILAGTVLGAGLIALILQNMSVARAMVWLAGIVLLIIFGILIKRSASGERRGLIAVLILTAQTMLFFIFYQQMSTSLTLFALHNVNFNLFGYNVPPEQFQWLNPFWIMVLSPLLAWLYTHFGKSEKDLSVAGKFAWGFAVLAIGFFVYGFSAHFAVEGMVSGNWLILGYFFQSLGELLISGLGLAMVARYIAPRLRGFMMGAWFLATGISQYLGSMVATFASVKEGVTDPLQTLSLYSELFIRLGIVAVIGAVIAFALLPVMRRLSVVQTT